MKRLLSYLAPHKWVMAAATALVLLIIGVELYRPIIIGDAIDQYINGYYEPYKVCTSLDSGAVAWGEGWLTRTFDQQEAQTDGSTDYAQIFLYEDHYYLLEDLTFRDTQELAQADSETLGTMTQSASLLTTQDMKTLRHYDFLGILKAAGLYLVLLGLGFAFSAGDTWMLQKMGQKIIYTMREQVFTHIHSLSLTFFDRTPVGKLVTRVCSDTEAVNELFTTILVNLFKNLVKILGYAVVMLVIDVRMALVSFVLLPVVIAMTWVFRILSRRAYQMIRTRITELNTFLSEHLSGMQLIQIFAREERKHREFAQKSEDLYRANRREIMIFAVFRPSAYIVSILAMIIVIATGASSALAGRLSLGTLFVFITYISSFFEPIQDLAEQFSTLQSSLASAEKVFSILDAQPQLTLPAHPAPVEIRGRIEFRHVWFAYVGEEYVLRDVSFTVEPGQRVAFVGATGAGKSTIINLLGRYYEFQKGEILIDGVDIREIDPAVLRRAIGQVQQDVFLFTGDIKGNISLGREDISPEDIRRCAHTVLADTFIEKLPGQYDAPVTERGSTLSAGQRQLISFARTLAYQPAILVLDEATANIDTETEGQITQALERLMEGRTTLMVAHRLSTVQHADNIIVLHHGRIRESGTHQQLLRRDGLYKKLYDLQLVEQ